MHLPGIVITATRDNWRRIAGVALPGGTSVSLVYNFRNLVTSFTDELSRTSSRTYDNAGRLVTATNPKGETHTYTYNSNSWVTAITNGRGATRNFAHSARGDVTSLTLPDGAVEQWSYLGTGQTSGYTSPLGYTNSYVFDDAGQMTTVDYPAGTDTTFAYDASGRHTQMVDATGTTTYTYNAAGELTSLAQPQGTTTYTYNAAGQRLTMNEAGSGTTTYSYDTAGRLASLVNPFSETTSFVYDTLGRVGQKTLANGTSEHYAYDTRSRLTQVQLKQGATVLRTTGYAWDNADQITSQTVNGVTTNYTYDLAGQLTSEVRTGYNVAYTYDANGNRLSKTVNGVAESYTYDLADKMLTAGARSYTYDAAGRTTAISSSSGTTTLAYDYESRVTAITGPGINETHTYNGLDTRVGTVQGGVSRTFVRDGSYVTDPVLRDGQATYTPGVSERRGGVSTWSHSGLKNADAQTTSVGAIAATRVYDAFGAELSATGTWKGPFGYAGGFGYQEDSSGLKLLGHRYYDPTTGRFLSRDPIKDGHNWYVYSSNSPITNVDANGLSPDPMIALEATWFPFRNLGKGAKGQVIVDGGRNTPIGPHTQLGWRNGGYGASAHVYPQARTIGRSPNGSWVVERMIDFSDHGRPWDHDIVHAHEYTPSRGGAVKVPGRWTPVPAPRNGPIAPIGGTRNPGSGGGLGAFVSVAMGLEALAQGAGHVFKWRFMIDSAQSGADYAADGESEAEAAAYARLVGAEE